MESSEYKLDNPVWFSLSEKHQEFSILNSEMKFYNPLLCPFGGFIENRNIKKSIDEYSKLVENFFIVGEKPMFSKKVVLLKELVCNQMILKNNIDIEINEKIVLLEEVHQEKLFELVNLVQPGYFKKETMLLGKYYGIFKQEKLVAVAGERMKMNDFTEISAIVTHPNYTGNGYAKQLITHLINNIINEKKIPFLHVLESNIGAINLYEKLGFEKRRNISLWNFQRNNI